MKTTCFFHIPVSLCLLAGIFLSGCDRGSSTSNPADPTSSLNTTPPFDGRGPNAPLPEDDPAKVAALEKAGFSLTRNADGIVTAISIVSDESISDSLPNLSGVPNTQQALFSGPGVTDAGMEALACLLSLTRIDLSNSAISDPTLEALSNLPNLEVLLQFEIWNILFQIWKLYLVKLQFDGNLVETRDRKLPGKTSSTSKF